MRRHIRECREGFRILRTREFWRTFRDYWRPEAVTQRILDHLERTRR